MSAKRAAAILLLAAAPICAHRLDEYLQGTLLSIDRDRLHAQMTLTPGVLILPILLAEIDPDSHGILSDAEQRAYAGRVLRDLSLTADGRRLEPRLISLRFPRLDEMNEGMGEIRLDFEADLPSGPRARIIGIENHHLSRISAYQVNALVPQDPAIRIAAQRRNYTQSSYQVDYNDATASQTRVWSSGVALLAAFALLFLARYATS